MDKSVDTLLIVVISIKSIDKTWLKNQQTTGKAVINQWFKTGGTLAPPNPLESAPPLWITFPIKINVNKYISIYQVRHV